MPDRDPTARRRGADEATAPVPDAHSYEPPRLAVMGSVKELTRGGQPGNPDATELTTSVP